MPDLGCSVPYMCLNLAVDPKAIDLLFDSTGEAAIETSLAEGEVAPPDTEAETVAETEAELVDAVSSVSSVPADTAEAPNGAAIGTVRGSALTPDSQSSAVAIDGPKLDGMLKRKRGK